MLKLKALLLGLGTLACLNLLVFIPGAGLFLILTLAPLLAGWVCAIYEHAKDLKLVIIISVVWSVILITVLLSLLASVLTWLSVKIGFLEIFIFLLIFCCNLGFCALGNVLAQVSKPSP